MAVPVRELPRYRDDRGSRPAHLLHQPRLAGCEARRGGRHQRPRPPAAQPAGRGGAAPRPRVRHGDAGGPGVPGVRTGEPAVAVRRARAADRPEGPRERGARHGGGRHGAALGGNAAEGDPADLGGGPHHPRPAGAVRRHPRHRGRADAGGQLLHRAVRRRARRRHLSLLRGRGGPPGAAAQAAGEGADRIRAADGARPAGDARRAGGPRTPGRGGADRAAVPGLAGRAPPDRRQDHRRAGGADLHRGAPLRRGGAQRPAVRVHPGRDGHRAQARDRRPAGQRVAPPGAGGRDHRGDRAARERAHRRGERRVPAHLRLRRAVGSDRAFGARLRDDRRPPPGDGGDPRGPGDGVRGGRPAQGRHDVHRRPVGAHGPVPRAPDPHGRHPRHHAAPAGRGGAQEQRADLPRRDHQRADRAVRLGCAGPVRAVGGQGARDARPQAGRSRGAVGVRRVRRPSRDPGGRAPRAERRGVQLRDRARARRGSTCGTRRCATRAAPSRP